MKTKILFVCLGNICRSPAAEAIFLNCINRKGLESQFLVDSAGTGAVAGDPQLEADEAADELFLQEEEEAKTLGAVMVIEWPERLGLVLPDAWTLSLEYLSNGGRHAALQKPINYSRNIFT